MSRLADEKVLVLDFGSQYAQLIARRVRQQHVYCEIVRHDITAERVRELAPMGLIFSGGPNSVYEDGAPKCDPGLLELGLPVLGICYGMQLACHILGGQIENTPAREYGRAHLHVTAGDELFANLRERGVEVAPVVLHVGPGTFRPVEVQDVRDHRVDPELYTVPAETASAVNRARSEGRRILAVGTTTTRTLESALDPAGALQPGDGETDLVIRPGHRFAVVDALVTNFHLPRSSLLLLVSAFAGRRNTLAAYAEAVRLGYRFYSYGDAMLIS